MSWPHYSNWHVDRGGIPLWAFLLAEFKIDVGDPPGSQRSPRRRRPGGLRWFSLEHGLGNQELRDKARRRGPTLTNLFGHSPGSRRTYPPGLCPGATVTTVEHGVPLVRPKWVHRQWAHQEVGQRKESRLAGGMPYLPHGYLTRWTSTTTAKD